MEKESIWEMSRYTGERERKMKKATVSMSMCCDFGPVEGFHFVMSD